MPIKGLDGKTRFIWDDLFGLFPDEMTSLTLIYNRLAPINPPSGNGGSGRRYEVIQNGSHYIIGVHWDAGKLTRIGVTDLGYHPNDECAYAFFVYGSNGRIKQMGSVDNFPSCLGILDPIHTFNYLKRWRQVATGKKTREISVVGRGVF